MDNGELRIRAERDDLIQRFALNRNLPFSILHFQFH